MLAVLGTKAERQDKDQFLRFQEELKGHVMREFNHLKDIVVAVKDINNLTKALCKDMLKISKMKIKFGVDTKTDASKKADKEEAVKELFKQAMSTFSKRRDQLDQNCTKLFGTIWGQCLPALQSEVIGDEDYKTKSKDFDCVWLLEKLKKLCAGIDTNSNTYVATYSSLKSFYLLKQKEGEMVESYHKTFKAAVDTIGMSLRSLFFFFESFSHATDAEATAAMEGKFLAIAFIHGANH